MRYPFNKYGWIDFLDKYIKRPHWNRKMIREADYPFIPWDISESLAELVFVQFKMFCEKYSNRFDEYKGWVEELAANRGVWSKEQITQWEEIIEDRKVNGQIGKNCYTYITDSRIANKKLVDNLLKEMYESSIIDWEDSKDHPGYSEMIQKGKILNFNMKWKVNNCGLITIIKKKEVDKWNDNYHKLEQLCMDLDTKFAKQILDIRGMLWD